MKTGEGNQRDAISSPPVSGAHARLQISSFMQIDAIGSHGGSMFQKRPSREIVRGIRGPEERLAESRDLKFPLGAKARLPRNVGEAVRFVSENDLDPSKDCWEKQIGR